MINECGFHHVGGAAPPIVVIHYFFFLPGDVITQTFCDMV